MKPIKILLVDDSDTVIMMSRMILKQTSFEIISASDGCDAVNKAVSEKPDLILLDIIMPNMDGFEALKIIRETEETSEIPVIMVTTRSEVENREKGFEYGCNDYIVKPFSSTELISKINNLLN